MSAITVAAGTAVIVPDLFSSGAAKTPTGIMQHAIDVPVKDSLSLFSAVFDR